MAITVRLRDFPAKASPVGADILYCGDSAASNTFLLLTPAVSTF
jgi:hypothetical protein